MGEGDANPAPGIKVVSAGTNAGSVGEGADCLVEAAKAALLPLTSSRSSSTKRKRFNGSLPGSVALAGGVQIERATRNERPERDDCQ